jgi:hypothetical protein
LLFIIAFFKLYGIEVVTFVSDLLPYQVCALSGDHVEGYMKYVLNPDFVESVKTEAVELQVKYGTENERVDYSPIGKVAESLMQTIEASDMDEWEKNEYRKNFEKLNEENNNNSESSKTGKKGGRWTKSAGKKKNTHKKSGEDEGIKSEREEGRGREMGSEGEEEGAVDGEGKDDGIEREFEVERTGEGEGEGKGKEENGSDDEWIGDKGEVLGPAKRGKSKGRSSAPRRKVGKKKRKVVERAAVVAEKEEKVEVVVLAAVAGRTSELKKTVMGREK